MDRDRKLRRRPEEGIALLIAIFVLLLISIVAIALLVSSGTETALGANYRSASTVQYAALAGLEEMRGRLLPKNPNYFGSSVISPSSVYPLNSVIYIINPLPGETVDPETPGNAYYDQEYYSEFTSAPSSWSNYPSVWVGNPLGLPGPPYKWVRVNAVTEQSLYMDVDQNGVIDSVPPLYFDGTHLNRTSTGLQALEITALAALPNGSKKIVQYVVAPIALNLNFPAAVILDGTSPKFTAPTSANFFVKGNDQGSVGTCNPVGTAFTAMGYTDTSVPISSFEQPGNPQGVPMSSPDLRHNYTNAIAADPDIVPVSLSSNLTTVGGLNTLVQTVQQNADVVINRDATQADMPAGMSSSNPMTIVVNGDLTFNGWRSTGYGILLVTGNLSNMSTPAFTYDPDASWNGIILVIGKGWMYSYQGSYTTTQIQGAVFIAKTVDVNGAPLSPSSAPASSYFNFISSSASNGIYYSSCWINYVQSPFTYKVISYHEIPQ